MRVLAAALSVSALVLSCGAQPQAPSVYLHFNGVDQYVEVPSAPELSPTDNGFTVSAWMMPDTLTFPNPEGSGYVHWMGKGARGQQEWLFRMYNQTNTEKPPRPNRISFYVFNPDGGLGVGSYFQDSVQPNTWIQVTGIADGQRTYMYKDGVMRRCDQYQGPLTAGCTGHPEVIHPQAGGPHCASAPETCGVTSKAASPGFAFGTAPSRHPRCRRFTTMARWPAAAWSRNTC